MIQCQTRYSVNISDTPAQVKAMPKFALIGIDGTGKTSVIQFLSKVSKEQNNLIRVINLRGLSFRFLSLPFLLPHRLFGQERWWSEGGKNKRSNHPCLPAKAYIRRRIWEVLFLSDVALLACIRGYFWRRRTLILSDRNVVDSVVDLMVALDDKTLYKHLIVRAFLYILRADITVVLDVEEKIAVQRKLGEIIFDEDLQTRRQYYLKIAQDRGLPVIDANGTFESVCTEVQQHTTST